MVGQSWGIYRGCCRFMGDSLKGSDSPVMGVPEAALCALRSQLLMALHDSNAQHPTQTPFSFTQVRSWLHREHALQVWQSNQTHAPLVLRLQCVHCVR